MFLAEDTVERLYSQKRRKVDTTQTNGGEGKDKEKGRKVCVDVAGVVTAGVT